ncbi:hypothetical protein [Streptomyces sp. NPDC056061]|uniref:hypothetical protein n=1 Tax=Streptomyces sp. NPDC056061 TaxID=3345700 RepID=UPI0035DF5F9E
MMVILGVSTSACGEEPPDHYEAGQICEGLFSGPLEKTIESVLGAKSFDSNGKGGMQRAVDGLKKAYESGHNWAPGGTLCEISPQGIGTKSDSRIYFDMYMPRDLEDKYSSKKRYYLMGKRAAASPLGASIYYECVSPQFEGSKERPMRIYGSFVRAQASRENRPDYVDENMQIAHAASLAVAKKLQCENNGGLPEKPVLTPFVPPKS